MKKTFCKLVPVIAPAFLCLSLVAVAHAESAAAGTSSETPLLVKRSGSGYVPEEWKKTETCEVYSNKIVVKREFGIKGSITSEEVRQSTLKGDYATPLKTASEGKITSDSMMVIDGPSYEYIGYLQDGASFKPVTLKSENGLNASMLTNAAPGAQLLINVLDSVCPRAFE